MPSAATARTQTSASTSAARPLDRAEIAAAGKLDRAGSIATGDTPLDIEAGHGAGIRVVGVATGEYAIDQLREGGADWAVPDLTSSELPY